MCRFTVYLGPEIRLSTLLLEPEHSLIRQSSDSKEREEPLNGDGFGVGWYARGFTDEPAVFRSITPAWNNRNLHNLARVLASDCILAHVRAATQSSGVNEANCHPFRYGSYLFMHNGDVGTFRAVRRRLLDGVCDDAFGNVYGSTDSEHFFAAVIDEIERLAGIGSSVERMATALTKAIHRVVALVDEITGAPCHLNCALADGRSAVISRFANDPHEEPPSLYYYVGELYRPSESRRVRHDDGPPVIVSSEKLTADAGWLTIPPQSLVLLERGRLPVVRAIPARDQPSAATADLAAGVL